MSSLNTGTPDWQRGVNSAQRLLNTVGGGSQLQQVAVPPNAQTIIVLASATPGLGTFEAAGVTTSFLYPVSQSIFKPGTEEFGAYFINVANCIDTEITCTFSHAPGNSWYIYADQGVHINFDPFVANLLQLVGSPPGLYGALALGSDGTDARALATDTNGVVLPLSPTKVVNWSAAGTILPQLVTGHYHLYTAKMTTGGAGSYGWEITDNGVTIGYLGVDSAGAFASDREDLAGYKTIGPIATVLLGSAAGAVMRYAQTSN